MNYNFNFIGESTMAVIGLLCFRQGTFRNSSTKFQRFLSISSVLLTKKISKSFGKQEKTPFYFHVLVFNVTSVSMV